VTQRLTETLPDPSFCTAMTETQSTARSRIKSAGSILHTLVAARPATYQLAPTNGAKGGDALGRMLRAVLCGSFGAIVGETVTWVTE
jgi:hypothetical protein